MKKATLLAAFLIALGTGCASTPGGSMTFVSRSGGFSVVVPGSMSESTQPVASAAGVLTLDAFVYGTETSRYIVGFVTYPQDYLDSSSTTEILDNAVNELVGPTGTLFAQTEISLDGHPGKEITYLGDSTASPAFFIKGRIYLVGARLYQVLAAVTNADADTPTNNAFLNSFTLLTS